jgi:hypothetical protein
VCGVLCIFCAGIGAAIDHHWHDMVPFAQAKIEDTKPLFFPTETLTAPRQQHRPRQRKELKFQVIGRGAMCGSVNWVYQRRNTGHFLTNA